MTTFFMAGTRHGKSCNPKGEVWVFGVTPTAYGPVFELGSFGGQLGEQEVVGKGNTVK